MRNLSIVFFFVGLFILSSCHRKGCPTYTKSENKIEKRG